MKELIFLGGLPRSGNTLLGSMFMQHPNIAITGHSNLVNILFNLDNIKKGSFHKNFPDNISIDNILDNIVERYYSHWKEDVIIDRAPWGTLGNLELIKKYIKPQKIKFILLKRSFKEILGSFYKMGGPYKDMKHVMHPNQMIRFDYQSVGTVLQDPNIDKLIIEYDNLVIKPQEIVDKISEFCGQKSFKLDIDKLTQLNLNGIEYDDKHVGAPLHKIRLGEIKKINFNYDEIIPRDTYEEYKYLDQVWEKTENFNFINKISNFENIKNYVKFFMEKDWEKYTFRQDTFDVHSETQTIPIIYNEDFDKEILDKGTHHGVFVKILGSIESELLAKHGSGHIVRAILVKLPSKCQIKPHQDHGKSLKETLRYHLPIITNEDVVFTVGGESKNLKEGLLWEIKNTEKIHSVINNGQIDRIHLIIDWKK